MIGWLRRSFITGFFVVVPLFISVAAFIWLFNIVDGATTPFYDRLIGRRLPGLGVATTAVVVIIVGVFARNMIGRRVLQMFEAMLLRVPLFGKIYSPIKQLVAAFNPDSEAGFKRVVMIEDQRRGYALGFLTREFSVERADGPEQLLAIFVPTNNLYLGDIVICERTRAVFPDISVEEGIRIFLTGGMALPPKVRL
jgi:uncharacterized membrane protein